MEGLLTKFLVDKTKKAIGFDTNNTKKKQKDVGGNIQKNIYNTLFKGGLNKSKYINFILFAIIIFLLYIYIKK